MGKKDIYLGKGIDLTEQSKKIIKVYYPHKNRTGHFLGVGATRQGKTKIIENMVDQDIALNNNVVIIDPKGDKDLLTRVIYSAFKHNRQKDLVFINTVFPQISANINPLQYYTIPEEIVQHIVAGVVSKDAFYKNVATETTTAIVLSLLQINKNKASSDKTPITFSEINDKCSMAELKKLQDILLTLNHENQKEKENTDKIISLLGRILSSPADYFAKVSSSLRTVLSSLSVGTIGATFGTKQKNDVIAKLERKENMILILQTGRMLTRAVSSTASKVFLSMLQSFIGRLYATGKKLDPPMSLYIDELSAVLYDGIEDLFNKAGGAGLYIQAFTQSIADLEKELFTKAGASQILDSTNTKIFMRLNDIESAKFASNSFKEIKKRTAMVGIHNFMTREEKEAIVKKEDTLYLLAGQFFLKSEDKSFKVQSSYMPKLPLDIKYPTLTSHKAV